MRTGISKLISHSLVCKYYEHVVFENPPPIWLFAPFVAFSHTCSTSTCLSIFRNETCHPNMWLTDFNFQLNGRLLWWYFFAWKETTQKQLASLIMKIEFGGHRSMKWRLWHSVSTIFKWIFSKIHCLNESCIESKLLIGCQKRMIVVFQP